MKLVLAILIGVLSSASARAQLTVTASSEQSPAAAAVDGDRFDAARAWKGAAGAKSWWWQCQWPEPRAIGTILQITGDDEPRLNNAPLSYVWQVSADGSTWEDLDETIVQDERRTFRAHRLKQSRQTRFLRMQIHGVTGEFPCLREVEVFDLPDAEIRFPDWIAVVSTIDQHEWERGHRAGSEFVSLARQCPGWEQTPAQHVWLDSFDEAFVSTEPRPVCAFLSGNYSDWCQKDRKAWRGTEEVLRAGRLPLWAACGGAQGLAILSDVGTQREWDCPHCRDPKNPKLPIYTHIGHDTDGPLACGHYKHCLDERGPHNVLQTAHDPVFAGVPREFRIMESHCGQIAYAPKGWVQIATKGTGSKTEMQCLRVADRPIYAAQFHIEMAGTPDNSRQLMANFLDVARAWGGYNPAAKPLEPPRRFDAE